MKQVYALYTEPYRRWLLVVSFFFMGIITVQAQVKGVVFRDFDLNGVRSDTLPIEVGVAGVTVRAFVDLSQTPISTITGSDGSYAFSSADIPAGKPVRIEFSNLPTGDYNGPYGKGSGTSVQFVQAPALNANVGINYPSDYCHTEGVNLVTPCYVNGNSQVTTDKDGNPVPADKQAAQAIALVSFSYEASGVAGPDNFPPTHLATAGEVGSVWALAYQRRTKKLFSASTIKRHMSLGPGGTSGLYITDIASGTTTTFLSLSSIGIDMGDDPHTNPMANLFGDMTQASTDPNSMSAVGRISFGGMDISDDDRTLYFVNLKDRKLYSLFVDRPARVPTAADVQSWAIPNPGCSNGDFRPWAVKVYRGKVYIGVVCSAETSQLQSDLKATIYQFDPQAGTFTEVLGFPLDFRRGAADSTGTCVQYDHWLPWTDAWPTPCGVGSNPYFVMYPQPIISDLDFDVDGSLLIGFMDRFGNLAGIQNQDPNGNGSYNGFTGGDLLRAYNNNGTLELEKNGKAGPLTGSGVGNSEGPVDGNNVGGEFYGNDYWLFYGHRAHSEVTNGAISMIPGRNEVIVSAFDPLVGVYQSGGIKVFNASTGASDRNYVLYTLTPGSFGKAAGLGDNKALCDPAKVEIGNRLWFDDNRDGIQDAYEPGIDGVVLTLHDMENGGIQIASQTTHDGGQFYFNDSTVAVGMQYEHKYEIRMDTLQLPALDITLNGTVPLSPSGGRLAAAGARQAASVAKRYYTLSPLHRSNYTDGSIRDSDARLVGGFAVIPVTTLDAGQNDFTNDLSIYSCPELVSEKDTINLCPGSAIDSVAADGKYLSRVDSVRFVLFSSPQSGTAMYGNGGTVLGTVLADVNKRAVLKAPAIPTSNNGGGFLEQYVYAIIYPTPENPSCRQTALTVIQVAPAISVTATGGQLTCKITSVPIHSQAIYGDGSAAPKAIYRWSGPGSFTSNLANVSVSVPGVYTVTVSDPACPGSLSTATATVTIDTTKLVNLEAYGAALPCKNCTATLFVDPHDTNAQILWTGPGSFTSTATEPEVSIPGEYTVTATSLNGCPTVAVVDLLPIDDRPCPVSLTATGGQLTCKVTSVTLTSTAVDVASNSLLTTAVYAWSGPNSFTSDQQNPVVVVPGVYSVTATNPDCTDSFASTTVVVTIDTAKVAKLDVQGATLSCVGCTATLSADPHDPMVQLSWTGPGNFTSTQSTPTVSEPGQYTVTATGPNGCPLSKTVQLLPYMDPCLNRIPVCVPIQAKRIR